MEDAVRRAIEVFNKYHSPEATARIIGIEDEFVEVEFSGPFCRTCGYYDYFEDLVSEADELGLRMEIVYIRDLVEYAVVRFRVVGSR